MKKILFAVLLFTGLAQASAPGFTQFPALQARNFHPNPTAERGTSLMTASNVTMARDTDAADSLDGLNSFALTSATHTAFIRTNDITFPKPYADGGNCEAQVYYKGDGTKWQLEIRDTGGTNVVASQALTNQTTWTKAAINFPCFSLARIYVTSTASSPADLNVGKFYWGPATNIGTLSPPATIYGTLTQAGNSTGGCRYTRLGANASLGDVGTGSNCNSWVAEGAVAAVSSTDIDITLPNLPEGKYEFTLIGAIGFDTTTASNCYLAFSDGTNTFGKTKVENAGANSSQIVPNTVGVITYTGAPTTRTITLQAASSGVVNCGATNENAVAELKWVVKRFPSASESAYRPEQTPGYGWLRYNNASNCNWQNTGNSWDDIAADSDCNSTTVVGDVVLPSTVIPGIRKAVVPADTYEVKFQFPQSVASASDSCRWRITDGTSYSGWTDSTRNANYDGAMNGTLIGTFKYNDLQASGITWRLQSIAIGNAATCQIPLTNSDLWLEASVTPLNRGIKAPVLIGSVTSNSNSAERLERIYFTYPGGTPTIQSQSGAWVTSLTDNGTGNTTLNIATGIFSAAPTCTCTTQDNGVAAGLCDSINRASWTATSVTVNTSVSGSSADTATQVLCMGPR